MENLDFVGAAVFVVAMDLIKKDNKKRRRKRRWSVRPINLQRKEKGNFNSLLREMRLMDKEQFLKYTRMSSHQFDEIVTLISTMLTKKCQKEALSPSHRLAITL